MGMNNPLNAYRETRVRTASPGQIIIMLYTEAVRQLDIAIDYLGKDIKKNPGNIEKINISLVKTQDIVTELMASLDFEAGGEIAQNLFSLYTFFNRELVEANIKKDIEKVSQIRKMVDDLRFTWQEIVGSTQTEGHGKYQSGVNIAG